MHWKSVDDYVETLLNCGLIKGIITFGTSPYFKITNKGAEVPSLIDNDNGNSLTSNIQSEPKTHQFNSN